MSCTCGINPLNKDIVEAYETNCCTGFYAYFPSRICLTEFQYLSCLFREFWASYYGHGNDYHRYQFQSESERRRLKL
jgi:hypothetical protein